MNASIKKWFRGLISTAISSAAAGVTLTVVDPATFNFNGGLYKLGEVCAALALVHVAAYLQKSPLWDENGTGSSDSNQ